LLICNKLSFRPAIALAALAWAVAASPASVGAPYAPARDDEVLERLPLKAADPKSRELRALRARLAANPQDAGVAVELATRYAAVAAEEGDPRYIGYAQAALGPWWDAADAPADVLIARAVAKQYRHDFAPALADLQRALAKNPQNVDGWAWRAAVEMVMGDYAGALRSCEQVRGLGEPLMVTACAANAESMMGRLRESYETLRRAYAGAAGVRTSQRFWVLKRLAEMADRLGDARAAEQYYRQALALGITEQYLLAVYADFLIDAGRRAEAVALLKDWSRSDILLLRLAIAEKDGDPAAYRRHTAELEARYAASRLRGERLHIGDESRFALEVKGDAKAALALALENWKTQREPADARAVLEAAAAAGDPAAAAPVLDWMAANRIQHARLEALAAKLRGTLAR
jgi:Tfp pilus assembly protein PilF